MRVKINNVWYDAVSDDICIELTPKDKQNIANMHSDADTIGYFRDDHPSTSEEKLEWMGKTSNSLKGTVRDLKTIEDHVARLEGTVLLLWEYKEMKILHCRNAFEFEDATETLRNLRHDVGAVLSSLRKHTQGKP